MDLNLGDEKKEFDNKMADVVENNRYLYVSHIVVFSDKQPDSTHKIVSFLDIDRK